MKNIVIVLLGFLLTACSEKLEKDASDTAAFQYGYLLAKTNASSMHEHSCDIKKIEHVKYRMIAEGCKAFIFQHPELFRKDYQSYENESEGEVRLSHMQEPFIRPNPSKNDFQLGYKLASSQGLSSLDECNALEGSYTFVDGCKQYVTEASIPPEDDEYTGADEMSDE